MSDGLSELYRELLSGSYDCVDRIVLNAYFGMGHSPGGFRVWWRALTGSDETLNNAHLMRLAGRFSRRVRGYAGRRCNHTRSDFDRRKYTPKNPAHGLRFLRNYNLVILIVIVGVP